MKKLLLLAAASIAACSAPAPAVTPQPAPGAAAVTIPSATPASASAPARPALAWTQRPKTLAMRTVIEGPLVLHADGTSSLGAAQEVVRVSDHYSACFVTRSAEVACWGVATGGTWNGIAKRDPDAGLHDVVDVAINQTNACAATRDGSVLCWSGDGRPRKQELPAPAREILVSVQGRACALLEDGTVAAAESWKTGAWERLRQGGAPVGDVVHLLACDRTLACGERASGGAVCVSSWDAADVRRGVREEQQSVVRAIAGAPREMHLAMNDPGTAYCAYSATEVRCFDGKTGIAASITELTGITEVAIGWSTFGRKTIDAAGCARAAGDQVRCWDLADPRPVLIARK